MEQERVVSQVGRTALVTGEFVLKALYLSFTKATEVHHHHKRDINYTGQTSWDKFMATPHSKEVKAFLANEVNLSALKEELKEYGIGFAFHHHSDGTVSMAYDFKNKAVVEAAFSRVIERLTTSPQELVEKLERQPNDKQLGQKIREKEQTMSTLIKQTQLERQAKQETVVTTTKSTSMTGLLDQTKQGPQLTLTQEKSL